ncbi:GTP pyrophosphokinase family protein [Anaerolentibacter hominis]|uniref:GTP pyrophosphokinase n=1 Tax=Anaerolentibacter hominis TaxID=3079009 RepID=UPI0031B84B5F
MKQQLTKEFFKQAVLRGNAQEEEFVSAMRSFQEMMMLYECAIKEVRTKLEILNIEFQANHKRNPIDTIKSRVKNPMSIFEKMVRKGYELSLESIRLNLHDVAGIRVICPFIDDIYFVAKMLSSQDDLKIKEWEDYIRKPKENGYRSLHMIVEVPVYLSDRKQPVQVEVQIRTIAMNFWASLEHQIHYKKFDDDRSASPIIQELKECADTIFETDTRMQEIKNRLEMLQSAAENSISRDNEQ